MRRRTVATLCEGQAKIESGRSWIPLTFQTELRSKRWWRISYRSSLFDPVVRPAIRFETESDTVDFLMPAPIWGRGSWLGFVPASTLRVWISPGHALKRHGFAIEDICEISVGTVLASAAHNDLGGGAIALGLLIIGRRALARHVLRHVLDAIPLRHYHSWRVARARQIDARDMETIDVHPSVPMHAIIPLSHAVKADALHQTLLSLTAQTHRDWSVTFVTDLAPEALSQDARRLIEYNRARIVSSANSMLAGIPRNAWVITMAPGDILAPHAFAVVHHEASQDPAIRLIYSDEDEIDSQQYYRLPKLKPDWSPIFQQTSDYLGRAVWFHRSVLAETPIGPQDRDLRFIAARFRNWPGASVRHIRRVLYTATKPKPRLCCGTTSMALPIKLSATEDANNNVVASVIIPTKDKAPLLASCLRSLTATTGLVFETIIVDNGSVQPETAELYAKLHGRPHLAIIHAPGPFNFSRLCNLGAKTAKTSILVFLNNDTSVLHSNWLEVMTRWACQSDVGAVGAKLLYPSMRVQHAGLAMGLYGVVAHTDVGLDYRTGGYLGRLACTREVSAVTGACLAISKRKFEAVAGFDEVGFPVELNDIDLCLRLAVRGWKTVLANDALLVHHESASRGRARQPEVVYRHELTTFRNRWKARLWDDPYFHPALSLSARRPRLC